MADKIIVIKEYLPQRCEICHQSDMFVAATGECTRCKDVARKFIESVSNTRRQLNNEQNRRLTNGLQQTGLMCGAILGVMFIYLLYLEPLYSFFFKLLGSHLAGLLLAVTWLLGGILGIWFIDRIRKY